MEIKLNNNRYIGDNHKPYFIAELNTSHFGDVSKAKKMIDMVKECGGDCVKFQSWSEDTLYSNDYYKENPIAKRFVKKFSLNEEQLKELSVYARGIGIDFASTPYSIEEADFLIKECGVPYIKVASMDINNYPYLRHLAKSNTAIILSTGMADIDEISKAVKVLEDSGAKNVCVLHCVSIYPVEAKFANLNNIKSLKKMCLLWIETYYKHVIIGGLDGDYQRNPIGELLELIPYADKYQKLCALCKYCNDGTKAIFSKRIMNNQNQILIGGSELYVSVCRFHYLN
jgi:N-acetylneuraminate synthase